MNRTDLAQRARQAPVRRVALLGLALAAVGGIALVSGLLGGHPDRTWWAYHANFVFWAGLAQGMVVFAATQKLAKGHWSGVLIRVAEAGAAFTAVSVVLFVGLFIGRDHIFTWLHEPRPEIGGGRRPNCFYSRTARLY